MDEYIKQWLSKAESDMQIIKHELSLPDPQITRDAVCFHCQQAVEKFFKAFLIYHKTDFRRTHDLEYLLELCSNIDNDFANIDTRDLSNFGVDIRYPDDYYVPDIEEVKFYSSLAEKIKYLVLEKLKNSTS